jgi:hypothetical protein
MTCLVVVALRQIYLWLTYFGAADVAQDAASEFQRTTMLKFARVEVMSLCQTLPPDDIRDPRQMVCGIQSVTLDINC